MPLPLNPFLAAILGQAQAVPVVDPTRPRVTSMKPRVKGGVADYSATLGPAWSTENRGEHPAQTIVDRSGGGGRIAMGPTGGAFAPPVGAGEEPWSGQASSPIQTTIYRAEPGTRQFVFRRPPPGPTPGVNLADPGAQARTQDQIAHLGTLIQAMGEAGGNYQNSPQYTAMSGQYAAMQDALNEQAKTGALRSQAETGAGHLALEREQFSDPEARALRQMQAETEKERVAQMRGQTALGEKQIETERAKVAQLQSETALGERALTHKIGPEFEATRAEEAAKTALLTKQVEAQIADYLAKQGLGEKELAHKTGPEFEAARKSEAERTKLEERKVAAQEEATKQAGMEYTAKYGPEAEKYHFMSPEAMAADPFGALRWGKNPDLAAAGRQVGFEPTDSLETILGKIEAGGYGQIAPATPGKYPLTPAEAIHRLLTLGPHGAEIQKLQSGGNIYKVYSSEPIRTRLQKMMARPGVQVAGGKVNPGVPVTSPVPGERGSWDFTRKLLSGLPSFRWDSPISEEETRRAAEMRRLGLGQ